MKKEISFIKEEVHCPICFSNKPRKLGIRGNREYFGADINIEQHIVTNVVQCMICDFIYTNPMIKGLEFLEKNYYNSSDEYSTVEGHSPAKMFQKRLSFFEKYKNCGRLLDVGAGKGEFLFEAKKNNWDAVGIEHSPIFCEFAKENYKVNVFNGFLGHNYSIKQYSFDIVTMNHVLEHVDRPHNLLKLTSNYLNKDGLIFIEVPNAASYFLRIVDFYFKLKGLNWSSRLSPLHPPYHKYGFTKKSLSYLLKKCNYQIIEIKTFSGRGRGYQKKKNDIMIEAFFRNTISTLANFIGNRELLCVVAKPIR